MIRRRSFITLLGGAAAGGWPLRAWAQQRGMPLVAFINSGSAGGYQHVVVAFRQGLKEAGYVEGQNVTVEYRWAEGQFDRVPVIALELVSRGVAVIVANSPGVQAIKSAVTTIPIVFTTALDPVQIGLIASLARPGGNVTGATSLAVELIPKQLEIARDLLPAATSIDMLVNPTNPNTDTMSREGQAAARTLGLQLHVLKASAERDLDTIFATFGQRHSGALVISPDALFSSNSQQLAALTAKHAVPAISSLREFPAAGGLMSYGGSLSDAYRLAGIYTGRILKGEKPAELPVQQTAKIELVINLKTAKALGITVPLTLRGRADEVIE
jgi:putative ABC transport system substrate-binding protein